MDYIFDGVQKTILLTAGTTKISVRDLWSRWVSWFLTEDNSKYPPAFKTVGGDAIDAAEGVMIPIYSFLENGWRIKPQEANHTLIVNDGILLVSEGGDPFVNTYGPYTVRINYQQPLQAISFTTNNTNQSTVNANIVSVTGTPVTDVDDFKGGAADVSQILANQEIINDGIKKASLLIPHTTNL